MKIPGFKDCALAAEASLGLATAAMALQFQPFDKVMAAPAGPMRKQEVSDRAVRRLIWAVQATSRRMPFRAKCFESALCLRMMLHRRGIQSTLHYGIRQNAESELKAHVWLSVDGKTLIGGEVADQFACVASFPSLAER